jgi:hypothetical protein
MYKMEIILFKPEIKHYCTQWRHTDSASLKKLCAIASEQKITAVFWGGNSTIPAQCIPGSNMDTGNIYQIAVKVPCMFMSYDTTC